jgi:large subunit ribosomal protein L24
MSITKVKKGDKVLVIAGKYKRKEAIVKLVLVSKNQVILENINLVKRCVKNKDSGENFMSIEKPIDISNVKKIVEKNSKDLLTAKKTKNKA